MTARIGGKEFAVPLSGADLQTAQELAEMMRLTVAKSRTRRPKDKQAIETVTVSPRLVHLKFDESAERWFERANTATYAAKRTGRNRIAVG